jgi:hypothetical protein
MLRQLLAAIGLGTASLLAAAAPPYAPYADSAADGIYNLLFCDVDSALRPLSGEEATNWQKVLFSEPADGSALAALATDASAEGRIRALAFNRLRAVGEVVPRRVLLGIVVEVALEGGLDTLAAFSDGGIRYINQSSKLLLSDGPNLDFQPLVAELLAAGADLINQLSPSQRVRQPPPRKGNLRITFIASDGLYGGEGTMSAMQSNPMAAPVVERASKLLLKVVEVGTK